MTFENPDLLKLLWGLPAIAAPLLFIYWRWRRQTLRRLGSPALEQRLLQGFSPYRFWAKNLIFLLGAAFVVIAMANPRRVVRVAPQAQNSADILLALDVSNSMLARDAASNRLEKAKGFIGDLLTALEGERLGLLFFAGDAQAQAPLSTDYGALRMFLKNANPAYIADQGTDIAAAIEQATRMIEGNAQAGRALILVSDGENHQEDALQSAQKAKEAGLQVYTVGIGSAGGATITDAEGRPIRTALNEPFLREVAQAGGGAYLHVDQGAQAIQTFKTMAANLPKAAVQSQAYNEYQPYFQWLLLPALLLLIGEQLLWWRQPGKG